MKNIPKNNKFHYCSIDIKKEFRFYPTHLYKKNNKLFILTNEIENYKNFINKNNCMVFLDEEENCYDNNDMIFN